MRFLRIMGEWCCCCLLSVFLFVCLFVCLFSFLLGVVCVRVVVLGMDGRPDDAGGRVSVPPMFATIPSKRHAARKRMLSNVYSKSAIQSSPSLRAATSVILHGRLLPLLADLSSQSGDAAGIIDIYNLFAALTMDFITAYLFGLSASTNFVQDTTARDEYLRLYRCRQDFSFWPQELPKLTSFLAKMGLRLVPKFVDEANASLEAFNSRMCEKARTVAAKTSAVEHPEEYPAVYAQMQAAMARDQEKASGNGMAPLNDEEQQTEMASEFLDHSSAGFETSSITLAYFAHEISQRPELQDRLREELRSLDPPLTLDSKPELPSAKALDALPLLQATLQETLRLHAAIPGPQPRVTPAKGASLGPAGREYSDLPGGVKVMSQAWSLHGNEEVFPEAEKWVPERWLDSKGELLTAESSEGGERYREMMRWFWAFGSGGRMCVGSHLAVYQMKAIIAGVWTGHSTSIVGTNMMEQMDRYTAPPSGSRLVVRVRVE
ncbi:uncharacterized protein K452DRAFT_140447 [Aplosporella prunicola CBS 121167]|uniref:Cytochrome P450 n=1 Tax=Aplosporella prunicola CBS 121167 TaxID=1176127 RepID=A0A6A6AYB3_9PEZI|nr:uncharacterized protein K452DRAFT_140447 [Aplosporella prunicola CBS 121167]KAF2136173.1 hypothetical protein K452DRAFT_140447 [Aplosporella prunicola CBS 121167]